MRDKQQDKPLDAKAANPSAELIASASWPTALLARLSVTVAGCEAPAIHGITWMGEYVNQNGALEQWQDRVVEKYRY